MRVPFGTALALLAALAWAPAAFAKSRAITPLEADRMRIQEHLARVEAALRSRESGSRTEHLGLPSSGVVKLIELAVVDVDREGSFHQLGPRAITTTMCGRPLPFGGVRVRGFDLVLRRRRWHDA